MNKIIGYSRKSTLQQTNEPDVAALKEAGAEIVFEEKISSRKAEKDRPQLQAALTALRSGDELVITKLDRYITVALVYPINLTGTEQVQRFCTVFVRLNRCSKL